MKEPKNHLKGNREPRDDIKGGLDRIKEIRKETKGLVKALRQPMYTNGFLMAVRSAAYIEDTERKGRPLTQAGLMLALGLSKKGYYNYKNGDSDSIVDDTISGIRKDIQVNDFMRERKALNEDALNLYKVLITGEFQVGDERFVYFSDVLEKANMILSLEREERLYDKGRVADIFALKALDGWQEEEKKPENRVLLIENEGATKALELLGFKKDEG